MNNEQLELAKRYVCNTGVSLFLTGKAGTGKTTFLHHIDATVGKRHVVVAPTGVAAVNAGGMTIHSFFQLPLCPYLPDVKELVTEYQTSGYATRLRKSKLDVMRTLELLIIDEVSMVRADTLDAIDAVLRRCRRSSRPFGGVQLLMVGDVHQLPPVVKDDERRYMDQVYPSPFFFHSKALANLGYITIELQTVYRQQDADFVALLNSVRDNALTPTAMQALNQRVGAPPQLPGGQEPIRLTTHNHQADAINRRRLADLKAAPHRFEAVIDGSFPETSYPLPKELELKAGARVMFVKNDSSGEHRYYNGKLATVHGFDHDPEGNPVVNVVDDDGDTIAAGREVWENVQYEIDPADNQIKQHVTGRFAQLPLRLAWAVTIHKAQGLTFDSVVVDAADAFAYGQVYVALSRCRSLQGLTLSSPLGRDCTFGNADVSAFVRRQPTEEEVSRALPANEQMYAIDKMAELYGCDTLLHCAEELQNLFAGKLKQLYGNRLQQLDPVVQAVAALAEVGRRFHRQLLALPPHEQPGRLAKATAYFSSQLQAIEPQLAPLLHLEVENKENRKLYADAAERLDEELHLKLHCLEAVAKSGFTVEDYQRAKTNFLLGGTEPAKAPRQRRGQAADRSAEPNPLVTLISRWRAEKAESIGVRPFMVLSQKCLLDLVRKMPTNMEQLLEVQGIGKVKARTFGKELLDMVADYREAYGVEWYERRAAKD